MCVCDTTCAYVRIEIYKKKKKKRFFRRLKPIRLVDEAEHRKNTQNQVQRGHVTRRSVGLYIFPRVLEVVIGKSFRFVKLYIVLEIIKRRPCRKMR